MSRFIQTFAAATRPWVLVAACFLMPHFGALFAAEVGQPGARSAVASAIEVTNAVPGATNASYVLGPNDLIRVAVYREPDLTTEARVDQDGTISLPLIEGVKVGGRSIAEANAHLKELYEKDYLKSATVMITLLQTARTNALVQTKLQFSISGQVKKPGVVDFPEGGGKLDLVRAIALAGDFTNLANQKNVTIKRTVSGVTKIFEEDVKAMLRDVKARPFEVLPNDVIEVRQTVF